MACLTSEVCLPPTRTLTVASTFTVFRLSKMLRYHEASLSLSQQCPLVLVCLALGCCTSKRIDLP